MFDPKPRHNLGDHFAIAVAGHQHKKRVEAFPGVDRHEESVMPKTNDKGLAGGPIGFGVLPADDLPAIGEPHETNVEINEEGNQALNPCSVMQRFSQQPHSALLPLIEGEPSGRRPHHGS